MTRAETARPEGDGRSFRGLFRHSAIYSAAPMIRHGISVGMTPFYTTWLGTAGTGVKEIVDFWAIALQQLLGQNVLGAMVRFFYEHKDPDKRAKVVSSCTILVTLLAWTVCGTAFLFRSDLAPWVMGKGEQVSSSELVTILGLTLILIPFQLSTLSGLYYLQTIKKSGLYTSIQTTKLLVEVGLNFYLIGYQGLGVRGFLTSMLIGEMITTVALTGWMLVKLRPRIDWSVMAPVFAYAAPLVPVGVCQLAIHQLDRRLLLHFGEEGMAQSLTGIYGLGYKISYLVTAMMLGPFIQIWQPWVFGVEDEKERARLVAKGSTYAVLLIAGASLGVVLFGRQAAILLAPKDQEFWAAYRVIPLIATGYVFWALYHLAQMPLFIAKRTWRLFAINLVAVAINAGLNAVLIPRYGITGAAITTFVTFGALSLMGMIASRSEAHVQFEVRRLVAILSCVVSGGAFALWMDTLDSNSEVTVLVALLTKGAVLCALLWLLWSQVLRNDERSGVLNYVQERRRRKSS